MLETGFDEEGGAIKLPHTAQKREKGEENDSGKEKVSAIVRNQHHPRFDVCDPKAYIHPVVLMTL